MNVENLEDIKIDIENIDSIDNNVEILGKNQHYSLTMYLDENVEYKYLVKFIKYCERLVRSNEDYKLWLSSIRDNSRLSQDAFLYNLTSSLVEIQLHHYPINLFNITQAVIMKYLKEKQKISTFIIADEVIQLHFKGIIGLVPLTVTTHEIAHLDKLQFVRSQIYGDWELFYNQYKDYLDDYDHIVVKKLLDTTHIELENNGIKLIGSKEDE